MSIVKWGKYYDYYSNSNLNIDNTYIINNNLNTITLLTNNNLNIIAGIPMQYGYRDSSLLGSLFNNSKSLLFINYNNYFNISTEFYYQSNLNATQDINYFINDVNTISILAKNNSYNSIDSKFLLVSDTGNHCIRILFLEFDISKTIAGVCGKPGFKDGPLSINLLDTPKTIGVDLKGNIFIDDFNNKKIRLLSFNITEYSIFNIEIKANLKTLITGSCKRLDSIFSNYNSQYNLDFSKYDYSLCYENWIDTTIDINYFNFTEYYNYCYQPLFNCSDFQNNTILNYSNNLI